MYRVNSPSFSAIAETHHISFTVAKVCEKAQHNTDSLLQFNPEAFLNMVADMSDEDLMNYIKQQDLGEMKNKTDQVHYYLLRYWAGEYKTEWRSLRSGIKHFMANFMQGMMLEYIQKKDYKSVVFVLRFIGTLSRCKDMTPIFLDSQQMEKRGEVQVRPWLEKYTKEFWIS